MIKGMNEWLTVDGSGLNAPADPSNYIVMQRNPYPEVRDIETEAREAYERSRFTWEKWWRVTLDHLKSGHTHRRWIDYFEHWHFRYDEQ